MVPTQLPFSQLRAVLMAQGGKQHRCSPEPPARIRAGLTHRCYLKLDPAVFLLNWLSDENLVMLLSPHLWLQNVQACCTLRTGGVMLAHAVTHGHRPCATTRHARVLAFLSSATPDVLQFYTHKGQGFASV